MPSCFRCIPFVADIISDYYYYLAGCTMFPPLPAELQNINLYLLLLSIFYVHFRSQWKADVRNNFQIEFL